MSTRSALLVSAVIIVVTGAYGGDGDVNLLPNGGFEEDTDGDGVADGWLGEPYNFARETLEEAEGHVRGLPPYEEMLKGTEILSHDGWPLARRKAGEPWEAWVPTADGESWLRTVSHQQNTRFGEPPLPEGLDLGGTTCVVRNGQANQTVSEPIRVKPGTGYRLSYWFKMSGGAIGGSSDDMLFQIIDADAAINEAWPGDGTDAKPQVVSYKNLG